MNTLLPATGSRTRPARRRRSAVTKADAAVPPVESLERMLPKDHLWPIDDFWAYHTGGGPFKDLRVFTEALNARYGQAKDVQDYAFKSQMMAYEGIRAMFEAYSRNKYTS